jgi:hypothetical protein
LEQNMNVIKHALFDMENQIQISLIVKMKGIEDINLLTYINYF